MLPDRECYRPRPDGCPLQPSGEPRVTGAWPGAPSPFRSCGRFGPAPIGGELLLALGGGDPPRAHRPPDLETRVAAPSDIDRSRTRTDRTIHPHRTHSKNNSVGPVFVPASVRSGSAASGVRSVGVGGQRCPFVLSRTVRSQGRGLTRPCLSVHCGRSGLTPRFLRGRGRRR